MPKMDETIEPEKSNDSDERIVFECDDDNEDLMDEEIESEDVEGEEEEGDDTIGAANNGKSIAKDVMGLKKVGDNRKYADLLALPPHGSEVFINEISQNATEDELRKFCEDIGGVAEVRLMKKRASGENKGFAFVSFQSAELAKKAIQNLNSSEFKGKTVKCSPSQAKNRLFIGNVPKKWSDENLKNVVMKVGPGITSVELLKDGKYSQHNRGYAFVNYYNHACAEYSRQKMTNPTFKLDNSSPTIEWASSKNASSATSQVKSIYVKNLPKDVTEDQLMKIFELHGKITKISVPPAKPGQGKHRFGFVHFAERSSTMKALLNIEEYEINGQVLECFLAKPQEQKSSISPNAQKSAFAQKSALLPNYVPPAGFGLGSGSYFSKPLSNGRGQSPASMAMMPVLLPNGQLGYAWHQPSVQIYSPLQQNVDSRFSSSSGGKSRGYSSQSRQSNNSSHGHRYRPF